MKFEQTLTLGEDGLRYTLPKVPNEKEIEGYELPSKKQKFVRRKFHTQGEYDKLSKESKIDFITQELIYRTEGYWFFNNGVPTWLAPSHYFFLNYWYMAAITEDGYGEYRWAQAKTAYMYDLVENDELCFGLIMMSAKRFFKTEFALADMYNIATRGATRNIGGKLVPDVNCLFGMQSLSATEAKNNLFKERLLRSHRMIPNYLKPKSNDSSGRREISSELTFYGDKTGDSSTAALNTKMDWRPTHASAYQGKRPRKVFWDEPGTIEEMDIEEALGTLKQQLQIGKRAFGKLSAPATLESMTPKGAPLFQKIWNLSDPNERDANGRTKSWLYRYFNPQYEGREDFIDEYGNSLVEEAKLFRQNELDIATPGAARKIKRQYPENPEEAFDVILGDVFESDVMDKIKFQLKLLREQKVLEPVYTITIVRDNYECVPDHKGKWKLIEMPKQGIDYCLCVDGVAAGKEAGNTGGSMVAGLIYKMFDPEGGSYSPIGLYLENPDNIEQSYIQLTNGAKFFNKFGNFKKIAAEGNAATGDHFATYLRKEGLEKWISYRQDLSGKGHVNENKTFQYVTIDIRQWQIRQMNIILRKYIGNYRMISVLEDFIRPSTDNTDIRDASLMFPVFAGANFDKVIKKKVVQRTVVPQLVFRGGKWVWEKKEIGGQQQLTRGGFRI